MPRSCMSFQQLDLSETKNTNRFLISMTVAMARTRINDLSLKLTKWRSKYKNQCISAVFSVLVSILKVG